MPASVKESFLWETIHAPEVPGDSAGGKNTACGWASIASYTLLMTEIIPSPFWRWVTGVRYMVKFSPVMAGEGYPIKTKRDGGK